jgi:hypothetical protein
MEVEWLPAANRGPKLSRESRGAARKLGPGSQARILVAASGSVVRVVQLSAVSQREPLNSYGTLAPIRGVRRCLGGRCTKGTAAGHVRRPASCGVEEGDRGSPVVLGRRESRDARKERARAVGGLAGTGRRWGREGRSGGRAAEAAATAGGEGEPVDGARGGVAAPARVPLFRAQSVERHSRARICAGATVPRGDVQCGSGALQRSRSQASSSRHEGVRPWAAVLGPEEVLPGRASLRIDPAEYVALIARQRRDHDDAEHADGDAAAPDDEPSRAPSARRGDVLVGGGPGARDRLAPCPRARGGGGRDRESARTPTASTRASHIIRIHGRPPSSLCSPTGLQVLRPRLFYSLSLSLSLSSSLTRYLAGSVSACLLATSDFPFLPPF